MNDDIATKHSNSYDSSDISLHFTSLHFNNLTWFCEIIPNESPFRLPHTTEQVQATYLTCARARGKVFRLVPVVRDFARAGGKGFRLVPVVRDFARAGGKGLSSRRW